MPKVVNLRGQKISQIDCVRVDRRTEWGNPFIMRNDSDKERDRVCDAFEVSVGLWPPDKIRRMKEQLRGRNLGCWCSPKRCHADTLLRIANEE